MKKQVHSSTIFAGNLILASDKKQELVDEVFYISSCIRQVIKEFNPCDLGKVKNGGRNILKYQLRPLKLQKLKFA